MKGDYPAKYGGIRHASVLSGMKTKAARGQKNASELFCFHSNLISDSFPSSLQISAMWALMVHINNMYLLIDVYI